jgi:hypothetical protein
MARKKAKVEKEPNWVQGQFEGMPAPKHLSGAGMSDDQKVLKDIGETAPMMIRAPEEALSGIAASRTILSQHDTGRSKGLLDPDERIGWEDQAFPDRAHHPVYGYLSHGEFRDNFHGSDLKGYANSGHDEDTPPVDSVTEYGNTAFELKPSMREHITFTSGDSLGRDTEGLIGRPGQAPSSRAWNFKADQVYTEMQVHPPGRDPGVNVNTDVSRAIHYRDDTALTHAMSHRPHDDDTRTRRAEALRSENRSTSFLAQAGVPHEVRSIGQTEQHPLSPELGPVVKNLEVNVLRRWKPGVKWKPRKPKRGNL